MSDLNKTQSTLENIVKLLNQIESQNNITSNSVSDTINKFKELAEVQKLNPAYGAEQEAKAIERKNKALEKQVQIAQKLADIDKKKKIDILNAQYINRLNEINVRNKNANDLYDKKHNDKINDKKERDTRKAELKNGATLIAIFATIKKINKAIEENNKILRDASVTSTYLGTNAEYSDTKFKNSISAKASNRLSLLKMVGLDALGDSKAGISLMVGSLFDGIDSIGGISDTLKKDIPYIDSEFTKLARSIENATKSVAGFTQSLASGTDSNSKSAMTKYATDLASRISSDGIFGLTSDEAMTELQNAMAGKSNRLGLATDSATFAGWAQSNGMDVVNVDITEEKRQQLMLQMINEQYYNIKKNGVGSAQALVKEWKTVGNIMEKTKNQTLAFDEVINLAAFDPEIPAFTSIEGIGDAIEQSNGKLITLNEYGEIVFRNLSDWLKEDGNSIDDVNFRLDEHGNIVLMTSDVYKKWQGQIDSSTTLIGTGLDGARTAAKLFGDTSDEEFKQLCDDLGLTQEQILGVKDLGEELKNTFNNPFEVIVETKEAEEKLNNILSTASAIILTLGGGVIGGAAGATIGSLFGPAGAIVGGLLGGLGGGGLGYYLYSENFAGHANGGISTKAHIANISEGNKREAILPLDSNIGINALSEAMVQAGGIGGDIFNINLHLDGINIADNDAQWSDVASKIEEYIRINRNRRGDLSYGLV